MAPPFQLAEFDIIFGQGISRAGELLDFGLEAGVITKSGSWFSIGERQLGQGREKAREVLQLDEKLQKLIIDRLTAKKSDAEPKSNSKPAPGKSEIEPKTKAA